jgi:hypothetical protein
MQQHNASHQISHSHRYRMPDQPPGGFWWLPQTLYFTCHLIGLEWTFPLEPKKSEKR